MILFTPEELSKYADSKYVGCVIAARYARKLHQQVKDSTHYLENKPTTESLKRLSDGELNYEIVNRKVTKKKPKSIFTDRR